MDPDLGDLTEELNLVWQMAEFSQRIHLPTFYSGVF